MSTIFFNNFVFFFFIPHQYFHEGPGSAASTKLKKKLNPLRKMKLFILKFYEFLFKKKYYFQSFLLSDDIPVVFPSLLLPKPHFSRGSVPSKN